MDEKSLRRATYVSYFLAVVFVSFAFFGALNKAYASEISPASMPAGFMYTNTVTFTPSVDGYPLLISPSGEYCHGYGDPYSAYSGSGMSFGGGSYVGLGAVFAYDCQGDGDTAFNTAENFNVNGTWTIRTYSDGSFTTLVDTFTWYQGTAPTPPNPMADVTFTGQVHATSSLAAIGSTVGQLWDAFYLYFAFSMGLFVFFLIWQWLLSLIPHGKKRK